MSLVVGVELNKLWKLLLVDEAEWEKGEQGNVMLTKWYKYMYISLKSMDEGMTPCTGW